MNPPISVSRSASQQLRLSAIGLACAALCALGGCARHSLAAPAAAVVVALPVRAASTGSDGLRFPAEVAARYTTAMSFRVGGKIIERRVHLGDFVSQGQLLARLDPADAGQQVSSAQATLDAAIHRLEFARQQLDRDHAQSGQNLIAAAQLEQTEDAYTAALAARDQAAAQLELARNNLRYDTVYADHDGLITSENADTGQVVAAGQAIYGLAWSGDTDVVIDAAEGRMDEIRIGERATVAFPALPSRQFEAHVREIAPAADPASRTYRIKLTLMTPGSQVHLGMTGEAVLSPSGELPPDSEAAPAIARPAAPSGAVFIVPATAIFHDGSRPAVWVVRASDSRLELRAVVIRRYDAQTATIDGGLRDGDNVVLAGVHTVFAGELVRPVAPLFSATDGTDLDTLSNTDSLGETHRADTR